MAVPTSHQLRPVSGRTARIAIGRPLVGASLLLGGFVMPVDCGYGIMSVNWDTRANYGAEKFGMMTMVWAGTS